MADTKHDAIARIETYFAEDKFKTELAELVAFGTESQTGEAGGKLRTYLTTGIAPRLERAGFKAKVFENPSTVLVRLWSAQVLRMPRC